MEKIVLGTLYFNDQFVTTDMPYWDCKISIRKAIDKFGIPFYQCGEKLVCAKILCPRVPWNALNKQGFITGKPVILDDVAYLCRAPKLGLDGQRTEWDDIAEAIKEAAAAASSDERVAFWGQELDAKDTAVYAGGLNKSLTQRGWAERDFPFDVIGYRPILEPLTNTIKVPDLKVGDRVSIYQEGGTAAGTVKAITDYDLVLGDASAEAFSDRPCFVREESNVIVSKHAPMWILGA